MKNRLIKPGITSGKVFDNNLKEPMPEVNIVVCDLTKKIIIRGISDENRLFKIADISRGNSLVEVQFLGYKMFKTFNGK